MQKIRNAGIIKSITCRGISSQILLLFLAACATSIPPISLYDPPYSPEQLAEARAMITALVPLPADQLPGACNIRLQQQFGQAAAEHDLSACTMFPDLVVYHDERLAGAALEAMLEHEAGHIADVMMEDMSVRRSGAHEGWHCNIPDQCPGPFSGFGIDL